MSVDTRHSLSKAGDVASELTQPHPLAIGRWALVGIVLVLASSLVALTYRPLAGALFLSLGSQTLAEAHAGRPELLDTALSQLATARTYTPDDALIYRRLAEALLLQGHPDEAVTALEQAHRLETRSLLIQAELASASIAAGELQQAQEVLGRLAGRSPDLILIGDARLRAGDLQRALDYYLETVKRDAPSAPLARVRGAFVAAALGQFTVAEMLLRDSGAPNNLTPLLAAAPAGDALLQTTGLLISGAPQRIDQIVLLMVRGEGWYRREPDMGNWASSPATLLIFTPAFQQVELSLLLSALTDHSEPNGLGTTTMLTVRTNGSQRSELPIVPHEHATTLLQLAAGWNVVELSRAEPNLRPVEHLFGSSDPRDLSIAVLEVNLTPR